MLQFSAFLVGGAGLESSDSADSACCASDCCCCFAVMQLDQACSTDDAGCDTTTKTTILMGRLSRLFWPPEV